MAPALFSTAFAGVKSIFQAIAAGQPVTWNSFLDVTGALLLLTVLFGRHFCGYACAFGSLGDAMYELTVFIRQKVFHKKGRHGYPEKVVRYLQKVKYLLLAFLLLSILAGWYSNLQGMSPWDVFSMLTAQKLPECFLQDRNHSACADPDWYVYAGAFFLPVPVSDGGSLCDDADPAVCTVQERPFQMPGKMRTLQETLSGTS